MKTIAVLFLALGVAAAQRENVLKVVALLRTLQPAYRDLNLFVVDAVAGSKRSVSNIIFEFQTQVVESKEQHLRLAIEKEDTLKRRLTNQNPAVPDKGCLDKLRNKVENDILLSGVMFSTCILEIDEKLNKQISKVYDELDEIGGSPKNISIYQAFRGLNIFETPQDIDVNLRAMLKQLQALPTDLKVELQDYVDNFEDQLTPIVGQYTKCLDENDKLLVEAFGIIVKQLTSICGGV